MSLTPLLRRQVVRSLSLASAEALDTLLVNLVRIGERQDVPPDVRSVLLGLPTLLKQVNDTYIQSQRDLALSHRSLEVSSVDLMQANRRLQDESIQIQRSMATLRHALDQLSVPVSHAAQAEQEMGTAAQADLETIARKVHQLARANEQAQRALRASEERLALAMQGSHIGLWDWNLNTDEVYFSDEWAAMLGYAVAELPPVSQTLVGLLHPEDGKRFGDNMGRYFAGSGADVYRDDVRLRCRDGNYKWIEFKGRVVETTSQGEPARATGVSIDISARKELEAAMAQAQREAEAASRAKGDFLANMSHEIRTPMNGILGLTEWCLATELTPDQRENMEMVHASARALLTVINDVLDFSKIEANRLDIEHIVFNVSQVLRHSLAPLQHQADKQQLALDTNLAPDVPPWLVGDPGRIRQVLVNLLGNAIKFTHAGGVSLRVRGVPQDAPDATTCTVRFEVQDTGIGMTPEQVGTVFQAFTQADTSITRRFGGTGLGLTISARLVELMGGQLQVESTVGQGSRFWFELPLPVGQEPTIDLSSPVMDLPKGLNVLVAEDNPVNQVVARKVLEFLGQKVSVAASGREAVQACLTTAFDLVFMDIQMPELDGFEATRRIRANEAGTGRRVPILAMTAHAMEGYRDLCLAGGMDGYVTKPIDRRQLVREMQRVLLSPQAS